MQNNTLLIHAVCFSIGFWWICHQAGIEIFTVLRSIIAGPIVGFAGLWTFVFLSHKVLTQHLYLMPVAALGGATLVLWILAHEQLAEKSSRSAGFILTMTFVYFLSPLENTLRTVAMIAVVPGILVLLYSFTRKQMEHSHRAVLTIWTVAIALVMGIIQLTSSPEALAPIKKASLNLSSAPYFWSVAMSAAGLMTLAMSIIPVLEWLRERLSGEGEVADKVLKEDNFTMGKAIALMIIHGLPMLLNWKYNFVTHETMLGYALVWSPMVSAHLTAALEPEKPAQIPGYYEEEASRVS